MTSIKDYLNAAKMLYFSQNEDPVLPVHGQGTVSCIITDNQKPFSIRLCVDDETKGFELYIDNDFIKFYSFDDDGRIELEDEENIGLDPDINCHYWFSLDSNNCRLRYGKGELRDNTKLAESKYAHSDEDPNYAWVKDISKIVISTSVVKLHAWRDPVTIDPPLVVVPSNQITMDMMAKYQAIVPTNLNSACQKLYGNVSGENFTLNTDDFPDFTNAIEQSIKDENGWCYKKLQDKASEFGEKNIKATYLRITMGVNQGESPGAPYVMEIWPPQHYSPIHNHANADAIIRVLYGEITVNLYFMLSIDHKEPFATKQFKEGDVTWLSPNLNQTHKLQNDSTDQTCITIQCYQYDENNNSHYEYFDYIDESANEIDKFDPNSDMDFLEFRELMREEWEERQNQ
jgi:uncharacterized cupin superfamily protein